MGRIDIVCFVIVVVMLVEVADGTLYKVGGGDGWTIIGGPNYTAWASSRVFHVGDTLLFEYDPKSHNVLEVNKQNYEDCNTESPIQTLSSGSDSIVIKKAGTFYYICGIPTHCPIGQKVEIKASISDSSPGPTMPGGGSPRPPNEGGGAHVGGGMGMGWLAMVIAAVAVMSD